LKLALLRHGPTAWNAQGRIQGRTDIPLSEEGLMQVRGLLPPLSFEAARAYASPMQRARQTAEALGFIDPILDPRLMEQNWGQWEGLSRAEILARDGKDAFTRAGHGLEFRPPEGESTEELHARVASFLKDVARAERDAIAVAHLGVLRAAYTLASDWDMRTPMPAELDVSRVMILSLARDGVPVIHALNVELRVRIEPV